MVAQMTRYTVTAERGDSGWWVLEEPTLGAVSQVRRLDQVADEIRPARDRVSAPWSGVHATRCGRPYGDFLSASRAAFTSQVGQRETLLTETVRP